MTYGVHVSLAPTWFDPGEAAGIITPYMLLYGLHDALVKAMPDNKQAPSLAESYLASEDGLTYEFVLRKDAIFQQTFHHQSLPCIAGNRARRFVQQLQAHEEINQINEG